MLGATLGLPGTSARGRRVEDAGDQRGELAGTAGTIVRPGGPPPWPALVFVNGATPDGRAHPMVLRLSESLARTGRLVTSPTCPASRAASCHRRRWPRRSTTCEAVADSGETAGGRVGLAGVSVGASLALLAAADPRLADRISVVACVAPYGDMANVMLLATTGMYRRGGRFEPYAVPAYLWVGLARSVTAILPPSPGIEALTAELRAIDPAVPEPVARFRGRSFDDLGADAASVLALLMNRDPARFDALFAALPEHVRTRSTRCRPCAPPPACARRSRS